MHVAMIERMSPVLSPPSSSQAKSQFLAAEDQSSALAFASVVRGLDVPVVEKQEEPSPLPIQVAEPLSKRSLGGRARALRVDPGAELGEDRSKYPNTPRTTAA